MSEFGTGDFQRLLAENARLAERLEAGEAERERVVEAWNALSNEVEGLRGELEAARASLGASEERAQSLQEENSRMTDRLMMAEAQLRDEQRVPVLPPSEVAGLVDRFLSDLDSHLPGMAVRQGELELKVGFEKVGGQQGFVVPTSESPHEVRENLHTISVRLGREPDQE